MCTMYVFQDLKSHLTDYLGKMVSLWAGVKLQTDTVCLLSRGTVFLKRNQQKYGGKRL